jgi:hypothetical protein
MSGTVFCRVSIPPCDTRDFLLPFAPPHDLLGLLLGLALGLPSMSAKPGKLANKNKQETQNEAGEGTAL